MGETIREIICFTIVVCLSAGCCSKRGAEDMTDLMWAVINGDYPAVRKALEAGQDVNARTDEGYTALMYALGMHFIVSDYERIRSGELRSINENPLIISELLQAGADPNTVPNGEYVPTPLVSAVINNWIGAAWMLLEHGADIDRATASGATPIYYAVYHCRKDMFFFLADRGANLAIRDKFGNSLLDVAKENDCKFAETYLSNLPRV